MSLDDTDPFDLPPFDPETGELLDDELDPFDSPPEPVVLREPPGGWMQAGPGDEILPFSLASIATKSVDYAARRLQEYAGDLSHALASGLHERYTKLVEARPAGPISDEAVAPELAFLADAHEVMQTLGKVFTEQSKTARQLAADVVLEARPQRPIERSGGTASVKVGTRDGQAVKVTTTQPTEVWTDTQGIVDVLVAHMLGGDYPAEFGEGYANGARAMADALLGLHGVVGLLAAPRWKSTALDLLRTQLQAGESALATRLDEAYGRRPKGELQTTIERTELRTVRTI